MGQYFMDTQYLDCQEAEKSFDGGFFSIKSPVSKASPTGSSLAGTVPAGSSLADKSPRNMIFLVLT